MSSHPSSENVKKAMNLEAYDRAIANPLLDQEAVTRALLLRSYDATKDDPDRFISKCPKPQLGKQSRPEAHSVRF